MLNRLGGQRWLEGPIQRKVDDLSQFTKPIGVEDLQDAINDKGKQLGKEDAGLAKVMVAGAVKTASKIIQNEGEFTLQKLEEFCGTMSLATTGVAKMMNKDLGEESLQNDIQLMQYGAALLQLALTDWVNNGRPELAQDQKMPLSIAKIRQGIESEGMKAEDKEYVDTFLAAFQAKHGDTISMKQLDGIHDEINAAKQAIEDKNQSRADAGLSEVPGSSDAKHQLVLQSLGAYRLNDYLTFSADQGEIGKLAAGVKPGAEKQLGGAIE